MEQGKSSIVILAHNYQGEVLGLWSEKMECASPLVAVMLAIKKACIGFVTYPNKEIQIESNFKVAVESLLGMCVCPWRALTTFLLVKSHLTMEKVDLLWCPRDSNE